MSTVEKVIQTENQLATNYDVSKFLHGDNEFIDGLLSASGADVDLLQGMVMGRIGATQKLDSIKLVNKGIIDENKINFSTAITLATIVTASKKSVRDYLNDLGLQLRLASENTEFDNQ